MKAIEVSILLFLTFTFLISFHLLDISDIVYNTCLASDYYWKGYYYALNKTYQINANCNLTNGYWANDAVKIYHIGMYGMVLSFITLLDYVVYLEWNKKNKKK